jgi:trigger factor
VKTDVQSVSDTRKSLVVSLDQAEVAAERQAVVAEFVKLAKLPGFRPGKAPLAIVEKRFAKDIEGEFKQKVVAKAYRAGLEASKLEPLNVISVNEGTIDAGQAAVVTVTVDVAPEFSLPEYNGIPTTVSPVDVSEAEVDAAIDHVRGERADFKAVERAAQRGDYVRLAYEGSIDGRAISEIAPDKQVYGKVPQTWEEVEGPNDGLIPGLGKLIGGLKAGDKKTVGISFPKEFAPAPALAGKDAQYALEIQEVRERALPELDEKFFKEQRVENLEALRTRTREQLKSRKEYENLSGQRRQVTDALTGMVEFSAPESLVESETQNVLRNFIEENMRRGVPQEQFEKDKKALFENARKAAAAHVKTRIILAKIAEAEKIKAEEKDISNYIYQEAMMGRVDPNKLIKDIAKDRERLRAIQQNIIFDKVIALLVTKAKVDTKA